MFSVPPTAMGLRRSGSMLRSPHAQAARQMYSRHGDVRLFIFPGTAVAVLGCEAL
jgi:hypothetical protein